MSLDLALVPIALVAAGVNGALGHGFSSITVPLALLATTNRVLSPALVLVEVVLNGYVLCISRASVPTVWRRTIPLLLGLGPGIVVGAYLLSLIDPDHLKLGVFTVLLPLILVQAAGVRRPLRAERALGVPFSAGVGILYSMTTISGPPLALMFNNQGFAKRDFRGALALVRLVESALTAAVYGALGLYTARSARLSLVILPCVLIGVPVGAALIRRLDAESFRRVCMSFDVWIVGFGLSRVLGAHEFPASVFGHVVFALAALMDAYLLARFFRRRAARGIEAARRGEEAPRHRQRVAAGTIQLSREGGAECRPVMRDAIGPDAR